MADLDDFRQQFYAYVKETSAEWRQTREQIQVEIAEYKKTVNTAIGLLSKEFLDFQDRDAEQRKQRQWRADIKDAAMAGVGCLVIVSACGIIAVLSYLIYRLTL